MNHKPKILQAIVAEVHNANNRLGPKNSKHRVELLDEPSNANEGRLFMERGFDTLLTIDYDFQGSSATVTVTGIPIALADAGLTGVRKAVLGPTKATLMKMAYSLRFEPGEGEKTRKFLSDLGVILDETIAPTVPVKVGA